MSALPGALLPLLLLLLPPLLWQLLLPSPLACCMRWLLLLEQLCTRLELGLCL